MVNKNLKKTGLSIILTMAILINSIFATTHTILSYAESIKVENSKNINLENNYKISTASELPKSIEKDEIYKLTCDIALDAGQQIESVEGILDGNGFKITLADKTLAKDVSGVIQNLGLDTNNTIASDDTFGSMAITLSGTIQNCYSTASIKLDGWMGEVGGLVGTLNGGKIKNSYFAGSINSLIYGGLVGINNSKDSIISNSYYTVNATSVISLVYSQANITNCSKKTTAELNSSEGVKSLNTDLSDTGFIWAISNDKLPILREGKIDSTPQEVDKSELEIYINKAKQLKENTYTEESWNNLQKVLKEAQDIFDSKDISQSDVDLQVKNLSEAINSLKKKKITVAVAKPENVSDIKHITSVSDLEKITVSDENIFYVLDNDITISADDWYFPSGEFQGILDGQGHTVKFEKSSVGLFANLGESGVIQNIYFTGEFDAWDAVGPISTELKGSIINCYSDVTGSNACGFAKRINEGILSNCYSISEGKKGVLFNQYTSGSLINTYWNKILTNPITIPNDSLINSKSMSDGEMKSIDFINLLNDNRGENGVKWGQKSTGYPYFGENETYNPETPELPENKYKVMFETYDGQDIEVEDQLLHTSPDDVDSTFKIAGTFKLVGVPEDSKIEWSCDKVKPDRSIAIGSEEGNLRVDAEGSATITATEIKADGKSEVVASVMVISSSNEIQSIKLFIDGNDVTNGKYTIEGSEWKNINVKVKYEDSDNYVSIPSSRFTYDANDTDMVYSTSNSSSFYFKKPGTASIKVTSIKNSNISSTVELTSTYVPVESIEQTIPSTIEIHGRNANSSKIGAYNPQYYGVVVKPENASNRNKYTVVSSNEDIGEYISSMVNGYVPYKAGTTTYKAILSDVNPETNEVNEVTNSKTVTYKYLNPLTSLSIKEKSIEVKNNTQTMLDLEFKGERTSEGYSVTEPQIVWTYDKQGIVSIERKTVGFWKKNSEEYDNTPDKGLYLSGSDYYIEALSEGTVTVTGTPVDNTNDIEPIKFTITVNPGEVVDVDIDSLVKKGIDNSLKFIEDNYKDGYSYGDEWFIYALLRSGKTIDQEKLDSYYKSVVKEIKTWEGNQKPTTIERVALTLSIMGKDITNIEGINLAEMIYNNSKLKTGSNELAYALIALDARNTEIKSNALWSRYTIINELLKFKNEKTGGFGLSDNSTVSVDMTAMALQALAPYRNSNKNVQDAIDKGLQYLKGEISSKYDFGTPESSAQVLLALTSLKINPLSSEEGFGLKNRNIITRFMDYLDESTGGFKRNTDDQKPNEMTTVQVLEALTSYQRYSNEETTYWELDNFKQETNNKIKITFKSNNDNIYEQEIDKGQGVIAPQAPEKDGYTFVGWFEDVNDITTKFDSQNTFDEDVTYTAKYAHVDMLGAQAKLIVNDKSGIRFGTQIYKDGDQIVEMGTIILPQNLLPEGTSLTLDTPKAGISVAKALYETNEKEGYVVYLGSIVNIPRAQFDRAMTASSYVKYKDSKGNEYTVYSPYKGGSISVNELTK